MAKVEREKCRGCGGMSEKCDRCARCYEKHAIERRNVYRLRKGKEPRFEPVKPQRRTLGLPPAPPHKRVHFVDSGAMIGALRVACGRSLLGGRFEIQATPEAVEVTCRACLRLARLPGSGWR